MNIQIAPSILSADFCNLERDLDAISNADLVHVDVMDHHFVAGSAVYGAESPAKAIEAIRNTAQAAWRA